MGVVEVRQAISLLESLDRPAAALGDRRALESFVLLATLLHHWPSRADATVRALVERFGFLKVAERGRFLKQRRIASRRLAAVLA